MFRFAGVVLTVLLVTFTGIVSRAQTPAPLDGPLMGSEADQTALEGITPAVSPDVQDTPRIVVVGDSIAGGLGAGMARMAQGDARIEVVNRFNESSGLARPEVYDWPGALAALLATKPAQAVVVLVGINDRQTIRDGNIRFPFRTSGWIAAYEKQVDRMIAAGQSNGARVYWINIPPMAQTLLDADMQALSAIHAERAKRAGARFIDLRQNFLAADGSYTDHGPDDTGADRKLRARDGVTFMKQGNNRFGQLVLAAVKADLSLSAPTVAAVETPSPGTAEVPPGNTTVVAAPGFGQTGIDGEAITFRADEVNLTAANATQAKSITRVVAPLALSAKAGSQSEALLVQGKLPFVPAGRFDDFSEPAPPAQ